MMQRLFVVALTWGLLVACGDGGQKIPNPPPGGNERPVESSERPVSGSEVILDQRPTENSERPISSPLPGEQAPPSGNGGGGRGGDDDPPGRAGGNSGPGRACSIEGDQCTGCANNCDTCRCADLDDEICDALCP